MGYPEKRGDYWRGRYKIAPGRYGTVADATGATIRFRTRREAEKAANDEEAKVRAGKWRDPSAGEITFGSYTSRWYAAQDLASSTMQNYRAHIESHLLPHFGDTSLSAIDRVAVDMWESSEKAAGYALESVRTYRSILHLILADAVEDGLITANPAARRRGRGKRAGRSRARGPEKIVTDPLGALLIAERAALLTGRDDEFVETVTVTYTGMRTGEITGLERTFVRPDTIRVEWQLYELDDGTFVRCPPKDDSRRTIDAPPFLTALLADHIARMQPAPCECHDMRTVFRAKQVRRELRVPRAAIAEAAGVSAATVSRTLNRPDVVAASTRARVHGAMEQLGVVLEPDNNQLDPHWSRDGFRRAVFAPAATGWYPRQGVREPARPVCLLADPWPGAVLRGRWSATQAESCWAPIATGLTPHGLRHSHRTWMEDLGVRKVLMDERMGHVDGSVSARYAHVTQGMRDRLMAGLTGLWEGALDARLALCPASPVRVLNQLLRDRSGKIVSQNSPRGTITLLPRQPNRGSELENSRISG